MGGHTSSPLPISSSEAFCGDGILIVSAMGIHLGRGMERVQFSRAVCSPVFLMLCIISPGVGPLMGLPGIHGTLGLPGCVGTALRSLICSGK